MKLIGLARIGADPVLRYTQNGDPVLGFPLAYDYGRKDGDGKRPTQWIDASLWGQRAEKLEPHLQKGQLLYVTLSDVHVETFEKRNDGGTGFRLVARIDDVEFTGKAGDGEQRQERAAAPAPATEQRRKPPGDDLAFDPDEVPF